MAFAQSLDQRLTDVARVAAGGLCDYVLIQIREGGDDARAVACSDRGDPALASALRGWRALDRGGAGGAIARAIDEAVRRGSARLLRQLHPEWLRRELTPGETQIGLLAERPPRSALVLPVSTDGGETLGAIAFFSLEDDAFPPERIETAASLARLAALGVERDRFRVAAAFADRARQDFLSVVSHELRSPLTTIIGYADLLKTAPGGTLSETQRAQVDRIAGSAWELVNDLERIVELVRAQAPDDDPRPDTIELAAFTTGVARMAEPIAREKGLDFRVERPDKRVEVVTDPDKLRRALLNILSNAVRYTRAGHVSFEAHAEGDGVRFVVRDTGTGIDPVAKTRIFEPFWRQDPGQVQLGSSASGGIGLGLALARHLVRQLEGDILVASTPGMGSVFTVQLPKRMSPSRESPRLEL